MKFHVPDMSCGHCVAAIEKAVTSVDPNAVVQTDLAAHTAEISATASAETVAQALADAGYPSSLQEG